MANGISRLLCAFMHHSMLFIPHLQQKPLHGNHIKRATHKETTLTTALAKWKLPNRRPGTNCAA